MNVWFGLAVIVLTALLAGLSYAAGRRESREKHMAELRSVDFLGKEKELWLRDSLREQASRHEQEMKLLLKSHESERAAWQAQVESMGKMMQSAVGVAAFGGQPKPATVVPAPLDAEATLARRIRNETIQAGMDAIKADYEEQGIPITDEEARAQAIAFIEGDTTQVFGDRA